MSGYAIFALKYPSLLSFEQQSPVEQENLKHLFGIKKVCSDVQMRRVLDEVPPEWIQALFPDRFAQLKRLNVVWKAMKAKKRVWERIRAVYFSIQVNSFKELFQYILQKILNIQLE